MMLPLMYLLQFPSLEVPQRTHFWNNTKHSVDTISHLDSSALISITGDESATQRWIWGVPIFHMPLIGGWKKYVVIEPESQQDEWYIGWVPGDVIGISNIPLKGQVRVLRGKSNTFFFGINEHGDQIEIKKVGEGKIGLRSLYSGAPLL